EQEIFHYKEAIRIAETAKDPFRIFMATSNLAGTYLALNELDSALVFAKRAEAISFPLSVEKYSRSLEKYRGWNFYQLGRTFFHKGNMDLAKQYYYQGIEISKEQKNQSCLASNYLALARLYLSEKQKDSSLYYAVKTIQNLNSLGYFGNTDNNIGVAYENLYLSYKLNNQFDSAFKFQGLALQAKDSLYRERIKNLAAFQSLSFSEQLRLQNLEKEKVIYQSRIRTYATLAGLAVFAIIVFILYRSNRQKQKSNELLQNQKQEIDKQRAKAEQALKDLQATQTQLVQSEKMASLGEVTAGIAHEIQNPLNFVNNFSEVNSELINELKEEAKSGHTSEVLAIADDVDDNLQMIIHHGKRADAIVKSMLQHSRKSTGQKEPTDINALVDEYLRLSYHGIRAKDQSFNVILETHFDPAAGKVDVVGQEIGRVLLNLFNNAFYSVNEKKKTAGEEYEPTVQVTTRKIKNQIEIKVKDNGTGIPEKILEKIYQPFFTTKPTGEGTGLGLSLSYDIITKGHGGELNVETKEGEGAEFIIQLPVT
ncbi:MAG TPA: ATP-binding protein, partial [Flavisolibacter sp.]|nr:ATP-binding protein [Flavisolibacter sp.]